MKLKLQKPIYPARDFNYSPTYTNLYNKVSNSICVVGQSFGQDDVCCLENDTSKVVYKTGKTCPVGYVSLYQKLGMKGHTGLDIGSKIGTPIFSALEGIVTELQLEPERGLGISITSEHKYDWEWNGNSGNHQIKHRYWHSSQILVKMGQKVKQGDLIALAGMTGYATGPHLHFEIKPVEGTNNVLQDNGFYGAIDPLPYIIENPTFVFNNNLWLGKSGEDVRNWQLLLADQGFLGQTGFAGFTGFFGLQTREATIRFQIKYGIPATGFGGKLTRAKANELYGR